MSSSANIRVSFGSKHIYDFDTVPIETTRLQLDVSWECNQSYFYSLMLSEPEGINLFVANIPGNRIEEGVTVTKFIDLKKYKRYQFVVKEQQNYWRYDHPNQFITENDSPKNKTIALLTFMTK